MRGHAHKISKDPCPFVIFIEPLTCLCILWYVFPLSETSRKMRFSVINFRNSNYTWNYSRSIYRKFIRGGIDFVGYMVSRIKYNIGRAKEFALSLSIRFHRRSNRNSKMAYNNGEFIKS